MSYDLKLAPEPDHGVMPAILIAVLVLIVVAVIVFLANPREISELKFQKLDLYAPHTDFNAEGKSPSLVGAGPSSEDDLYVVATVRMTNKLRIPIYITSTSVTLTSADGSAVQATGISPRYYERLEGTYPALVPMIGQPIYNEDEILPGSTRQGNVLLLFPGATEAAWHAKKSAVLTINLRNQGPQTVQLP